MVEFFKEIFSHIHKSNEEKMKLPIFPTLVISFLVHFFWIYWKPISIFILSDKEIIQRITIIEENVTNINSQMHFPFLWSIGFAVFMTLIYTLLMPWVQVRINKFILKNEQQNRSILAVNELEQAKRKIEHEQELKNYRELKNSNMTYESFLRQLEDKEKQISDLLIRNQKLLKEKQDEAERFTNEIESLRQSIRNNVVFLKNFSNKNLSNQNQEDVIPPWEQ